MWRRTYFLLILVRIYFALSPSYLHPDENFQGPEVIAGASYVYSERATDLLILRRPRLLLSRPRDVGIHVRAPHPQHLPSMARLRLAHVPPALALGGLRI